VQPRIGRLTLAFDAPELERDFRALSAERARGRHLVVFGLASVVTAALALIDRTVLEPAQVSTLWALRYEGALPSSLAFAALGLLPLRIYAAWVDVLTFSGVLFGLLAIAMMGYELSPMTDAVAQYGTMSALVMILVFHSLGMARIPWTAAASVLGSAAIVLVIALEAASWKPLAYATFFLATANVVGIAVGYALERHRRREFANQRLIELERAKSERLLRNVLPEAIAARLKEDSGHIAEYFDVATVLFADIVGFTTLSASMPPRALVDLLNDVFTRFDEIAGRRGLEKIKTIGDAYMVVGGVPLPRHDHAASVAALALEMQSAIGELAEGKLAIRIGIHTGPVVAGVIGTSKFSYDLWGDTVNTASRMESHGVPGQIHVSGECRDALADRFVLDERGEVEVKGKGRMRTWWLRGLAPGR
jgi:class 3 adenylate cyclase